MAAVEGLIFDRNGRMVAQVQPAWESVVWRLNGVGMAKFSLPYTDPVCTPDVLRPGNRLLIRFENGLPDWGGVIDFPRRRTTGGVGVTAYTGEVLLGWRRTAKARYFRSRDPGTIYESLITETNAVWPTGVTVDFVYTGGTERSLEYHYHDLLARINDLQDLTGNDWLVAPVYENGVLSFRAYWYQQRGADLSEQVALVEGQNAVVSMLDEQGALYNVVRVVGQGNGWGDDRPVSEAAIDADSIATYGYREQVFFTNATEQETLDAGAEALLAGYAAPRVRLTVLAEDRAPAAFAAYDVGDTVAIKAFLRWPGWSYEAAVRVLAREWTPGGTCRLEVG